MSRFCLSCVLSLRNESHALETSPEKLCCTLCKGQVVKNTILCHTELFLVEIITRTFRSLTGRCRAGARTSVTNFPRQVFDKTIVPLGETFKVSKSKQGGLSVSVRVTSQRNLNLLFRFQKYFPKQGYHAFKALKRGELQGIAVPVIFRHSISKHGEHKLSLTYNSICLNLGGRLVFPPSYPLQAKSWGKSARFSPESYIRAEFAKAPGLLLGRGINPKLLSFKRPLLLRAAKLKADCVWAECSDDEREWYSTLAEIHGIPEGGAALRRSARLLGK